MNRPEVLNALLKALPTATLLDGSTLGADPESDQARVKRSTDVDVKDPVLFEELVATLRAAPELASLEGGSFNNGWSGFTGPIRIESIARTMLAQALLTGRADEVVGEILRFLDANMSDALIVASVVGIEVDQATPLGPAEQLLPLHDLPPSLPRGIALGQEGPFGLLSMARVNCSTALVTKVKIAPVMVSAKDVGALAVNGTQQREILPAFSLLDETLNCLSLANMAPVRAHITWLQLMDPGATFISVSGWSTHDVPPLIRNKKLDRDAAQKICQTYFSIEQDLRARTLRVPLDRLSRAMQQRLLIDRAIDLGIALEALLLHDISPPTELAFRLRLRGALLIGSEPTTRRATYKLLRAIYDVRSQAVHQGRLASDNAALVRKTLEEGLSLCGKLAQLVIDHGGRIDFNSLELEGHDALRIADEETAR